MATADSALINPIVQEGIKRSADDDNNASALKPAPKSKRPVRLTLPGVLEMFRDFAPVVPTKSDAPNTHNFEERSALVINAIEQVHLKLRDALDSIDQMGMVRSDYDQLYAVLTGVQKIVELTAGCAEEIMTEVTPFDDEED